MKVYRPYFSKIWRKERSAFRKAMKNWFVKKLSSKERRFIVRKFYELGLEYGLFNHEINSVLYNFFGISFCTFEKNWKLVQILRTPTWLLKRIVEIRSEMEMPACWKIARRLYKEYGIYLSHSLIWKFLFKTDVEKVLKAKDRHDRNLMRALRNVGRVEQNFILAVEENPDRLSSIYRDYAEVFRDLQLQDLYYYVEASTYYTALIDSALIDLVAERSGLSPPELWRWLSGR